MAEESRPIAVGLYPITFRTGTAVFSVRSHDGVWSEARQEEHPMLWTIAIVLLVLWLLGLVSSYTMGGFIHILLVVAIVVVLVRIIQGRRRT